MRSGKTGYGLVEMMVAMTILTIVAAFALPRGWDLVKEYRLRGAAYYFRGLVREVRAQAAAKSLYTGIVFDEVDGEPELSIHIDGNHNGIRRADVQSGIDPRIRGPWRLGDQFPGVHYGSPPSGGGPSFPPLRIGRGRILSFSPIGTSTSGTLFLSNDQGFQYAVIILGASGRVRLARYRGGQWEPLP
jgi:prepilin-type N-terminal cleavage/methylation domain-containing protein